MGRLSACQPVVLPSWLAQTTSAYWVRSYPGGPFVLTRILSQNTYSYNAGGIRTANVASVFNQPTRVEQYAYDSLSRLTSVDYGDGVTQGYTFDNMGNRLTKTEGGTTETYGHNAANMLVSRKGQAYVNDANGNTLSGGGRLNTWDSQNRLVKCVSHGRAFGCLDRAEAMLNAEVYWRQRGGGWCVQ